MTSLREPNKGMHQTCSSHTKRTDGYIIVLWFFISWGETEYIFIIQAALHLHNLPLISYTVCDLLIEFTYLAIENTNVSRLRKLLTD